MLIDLLSTEDRPAAAKAARAISRVARAHPKNQEALAQAGVIDILVNLLRGSRDEEAERSQETTTFGHVDKTKPEVALMQKEVATALWSLALMQREVCSATWSLADNNADNQASIAETGGITLLVALLRGSPEVHGDAAGALWSLAQSASNQKLIADEGGIEALCSLLKTGSKGAQETSAGELHVLAARTENRALINDAKGITLLVALLEVGSPEAKSQAAGALLALVGGQNFTPYNTVNQSGVSRELVAMLSNSKTSLEAQEHATAVLRNLALDSENRASIASAGAIPQLARQLRDGLPYGQEMAASALSQLALKSATLRVQVTQELVGLLGSNLSDVRGRAANALRAMNATHNESMSIAMAGGIDRFVHLLTNGSVEAQEYALWSLWQSADVASKVSIAEAGCSEPIIATLVAGKLHEVAKSTRPPFSTFSRRKAYPASRRSCA